MRILPRPLLLPVFCVLLILPGLARGADEPRKDPLVAAGYLQMAESEPVRIGDLEFVVAVEKEWTLTPGKIIALEMQLYIINHGEKDVLFPTMDTFYPVLKRNGLEVTRGGGRDGTIGTRPVLIPAGGRYCLSRMASVAYDFRRKDWSLLYQDGTGTWDTFGISGGEYTASFSVEFSAEDAKGKSPKTNWPFAMWNGKGETKEAKFKIYEKNQEGG